LKIPVTDHDVVMTRVAATVRLVEHKIEQANKRGELQWFNSAYREWRLHAESLGRVMTYGEARARLRRAVITQGLSSQTFRELLPMVFLALPRSS
jgi:hypothetical protein